MGLDLLSGANIPVDMMDHGWWKSAVNDTETAKD